MNRCTLGHAIDAAFAFHDGHFLWGHTCSDGRYWAYDPCSARVASGGDWKAAALALGGTWS